MWKDRAEIDRSGFFSLLFSKGFFSRGSPGHRDERLRDCLVDWGLFTWIPAYLSLPVSQGGRGLSLVKTTTFFLVLCFGKWLGYASFGFFAECVRAPQTLLYLLADCCRTDAHLRICEERFLAATARPIRGFFGTGFSPASLRSLAKYFRLKSARGHGA